MTLETAAKQMAYAMRKFKANPSATNYLVLEAAMLKYQEIVMEKRT